MAANRLFIADIEAAKSVEVAYNIAGGYQGISFSPDGKWLVYSRRDEDQNADVYLYDLTAKKEYDVTPDPFSDTRAVFTADAKRLVFLSDRDGGVTHLFVVTLDRAREDPDDPLVKERLKKARADKKEKEDAAAAGVKIDVAGIDRRVLQLTRGTEADGAFFLSSDGRLVYFVSADDKGRGLFSVGIDGKDRKRVSDGAFAGLTPTADAKKVFYTQDGELYQMEMAGEKKKTKIAAAVTVKIDNRVEWQQIFDECWRVMKYQFYDEKMHGRDWNAIKATYEPLLKYVGENDDVYDIANEMIGELNASHTGVSGPASREIPSSYATRQPGFELEADAGAYRISRIVRKGPADKEWLNLKVGDYVLAIDGRPIKAGDNYWALLNDPLNEYVTFKVASTPAGADARDVRIRTASSLSAVKYQEWVERNREFVDKESNGQIAYVHIQSMNQPSLKIFQNEIDQVLEQEGADRRHPLQRRRQHRPGAARYSGAAALRVLEQPLGRPHLGPPAAADGGRAEGHAHQLALGLRQRGDADGLPRPRPRAHRRQPDQRVGHRDRVVRADQRREHPDARIAGRHLGSDQAEQLRRQPRELRRRARRVRQELARRRTPGLRPRTESRRRRGAEDAEGEELEIREVAGSW